jgi:hypothetical protein
VGLRVTALDLELERPNPYDTAKDLAPGGTLHRREGQRRCSSGRPAPGKTHIATGIAVRDDRFPEAFGEIGLYPRLAQDLRVGRGRPA